MGGGRGEGRVEPLGTTKPVVSGHRAERSQVGARAPVTCRRCLSVCDRCRALPHALPMSFKALVARLRGGRPQGKKGGGRESWPVGRRWGPGHPDTVSLCAS